MKARICPATTPLPDLTRRIKEQAFRLGFSEAGIAPASALGARDLQMKTWLKKGFFGELNYMRNFFERRRTLLERHSEIQSAVVLTASYRQPADAPTRGGETTPVSTGQIAQYARLLEYHRTLRNRLEVLTTFIRTQMDRPVTLLASVDTSPVQERALAEAAGLGFFGKNTCLIRPKGGSFFFLASVLTDLPLVPDQALSWDCGDCTLCLQACPTGALPEPYQLDASRCISALTIENRGDISESIRPAIGNWIFGCDICQQVCPYNRAPSAQLAMEPAILPRELPLDLLLSLRTEKQFKAHFGITSLVRAKREGILRNAAVAAGNLKDPTLAPVLTEILTQDPSPLVRSHAAWALGQIALKP